METSVVPQIPKDWNILKSKVSQGRSNLHFYGKFYTHHLCGPDTASCSPTAGRGIRCIRMVVALPSPALQGPKGPRLKKFFTLDQLVNWKPKALQLGHSICCRSPESCNIMYEPPVCKGTRNGHLAWRCQSIVLRADPLQLAAVLRRAFGEWRCCRTLMLKCHPWHEGWKWKWDLPQAATRYLICIVICIHIYIYTIHIYYIIIYIYIYIYIYM